MKRERSIRYLRIEQLYPVAWAALGMQQQAVAVTLGRFHEILMYSPSRSHAKLSQHVYQCVSASAEARVQGRMVSSQVQRLARNLLGAAALPLMQPSRGPEDVLKTLPQSQDGGG
jgi:hypothetical protein